MALVLSHTGVMLALLYKCHKQLLIKLNSKRHETKEQELQERFLNNCFQPTSSISRALGKSREPARLQILKAV